MSNEALKLDPSQERAVEMALTAPLCVITGGPGCHRKGQPILRADGSIVAVEDVKVGDRLAGFNGAARTVVELKRGHGAMALIVPVKGEPWVVNADHVLTVVHSSKGHISDVTVRDYLGWNAKLKHQSKLFRQGYDFGRRGEVGPITPYVLGVLLGDGCLTQGASASVPDAEIVSALRHEAGRFGLRLSCVDKESCPTWRLAGDGTKGSNPAIDALRALGLFGTKSESKFVPPSYLTASRGDRLELLAGLLDTDGHLSHSGTFDFVSKSHQLSDHVAFLCRSLGLAAYVKQCEKGCQTGAVGTYWRVSISGDIDIVPNRVKRKKAQPRQQIKDALRTGFTVDLLSEHEDFYGFTLDGDGRYLLGDFTVTHNTGKTTTLRTALDRMGDAEILLASPTGKAAKRMSEATGRPAGTVHRLLGFKPGHGFAHDDKEPLDADVIVIDESSMLDVELASALFAAIDPRRTRLILVGDADQLPSVGPGQVFADLVACGRVPVARLTHVHRSAQESWIARSAPIVLSGEVPDLSKRPDFRFVSVEQGDQVAAEVVKQVKSFGAGIYPQVLVPQNTLAAGADAINRALQAAINPPKPGETAKPGEPRINDRVIQMKNNYGLGVFNGEVGIVVAKEGRACTVDFGDRPPIKYDFESSEALKLSYALSVHKSQGSEFPWAIVVCHSTHAHMLTRSLIYTALTRAKAGVVIVGDAKGVKLACKTKDPVARNSGLVDRLSALLDAAPANAEATSSPANMQTNGSAERAPAQESAA